MFSRPYPVASNAFFTNPRLTVLAILFVLLLGGVGFSGLARQEDPTMTERWATLTTFLPGATAERMEALVSEPIETRLREIPEIDSLESKSRPGYSTISVELYDAVGPVSVDVVWAEIRDKLAEIYPKLPAGTTPTEVQIARPIAATLIVSFTWDQPGPGELGILSRLAESLRIQLANLPGTFETELYGEVAEEVLVTVDPDQLAIAGLTPTDVATAVQAADTKGAAGRLQGGAADLLLEVDAELDSPERIARIPLTQTSSGAFLRVGDIAQVHKHRVDPPPSMAFDGLTRAVMVSVKMEPERQIGPWIETALATVHAFEAQMPSGIALDVLYNQNTYTGARMNDLAFNLLYALAIVMVCLIWFMGVRSALTVGIALPLSGSMVLGWLYLFDVPLHQMSVTGLIISLGLLIDNAIVVLEDYKLRRRRGLPIDHAIAAAVKHLIVPLAASTATTVFAFLPIAMAPGGVGDFTGTIGLTVAFALISSFALAMTVVPALAGMIERRFPPGEGSRWWQSGF